MRKILFTIIITVYISSNLSGQVKNPVSTPVQANPQAESMLRGKNVYTQFCLPCHQADGGGVQGLNPPLIKTEYVLGDRTRLINIILKGFNESVEIDGEVYSNPMPPLSSLTDQQVADVLTYVRNNFQNKASAVTEAQVKAVREKN